MIDEATKIFVCAAVSVGAHFAVARGLASLPEVPSPKPPVVVSVRVVETPKPPPEPDKPPEPTPEPKPEPKVIHERPRAQPATVHDVAPKEAPIPDHPPVTADTSTTPVFGTTIESTSQAGTGPAVPIGNTTRPTPTAKDAGAAKPLAEPVAAYEVTKMPLPLGRCAGKYTDEARTAAIEGVVVLDIVVGEDGRARDIKVTSGLTHGLTEAAIAAVRECRFSPGEKNGASVPVRVREFKIRFVLQTND